MNQEKLTIYHNPNGSKSRETLNILTQHRKLPEIIEYLDSPPDRQTLERIIDLLGISARDLLRTGEPAYQSANLDWDSVSDETILDVIGDAVPLRAAVSFWYF